MRVIVGSDVNELFNLGCAHLKKYGDRQGSRNGDVLVCPYPVMSQYNFPYNRVLFDAVRDANPFFHLMESLWMLAGRNDAAFLNQYVSDFGARFAEPDGRIWGGYGTRWRGWFIRELYDVPAGASPVESIDQLTYVVDALKKNPDDRRVVIQMWDPVQDLGAAKKDVPCNTQVYPRVVRKYKTRGGEMTYDDVLDITVMCRSNDIVWGAYGANAVHFSVLQEYLAAGVGCGIGTMYQLSNNFHGYVEIFEKQKPSFLNPYIVNNWRHFPLVNNFATFDEEVRYFCQNPTSEFVFTNHFFNEVAVPAAMAYRLWRNKTRVAALHECERIKADDWRLACANWMQRRMS